MPEDVQGVIIVIVNQVFDADTRILQGLLNDPGQLFEALGFIKERRAEMGKNYFLVSNLS